ncbi:L-gulonolactone oxidase-like isoform X2 [Zonotrichia albicollis]|uniref:L-gulonolactone oxidase-like isoform X2 n=1 Tax=Zonotrichia albicollis TaxID=44394 RepID=UPI003D810E7E
MEGSGSSVPQGQSGLRFQNWAGTFGCRPERFYRPRELREIRQILVLAREQGKRVKVVGGGHSPSDIACTDGFMIHLGHLNRVLQVDKEKLQVKVEAGILLSELNLELDKHRMALENLGAVAEVTAAGVIGTGTHNTGIQLGILATQVVALTLLLASGEVLECSESLNPEVFGAARLHLGALGIVLDVTFQCVPEFRLREIAFPSTLTQVLDELEEHLRNSRYFRFLWFPHTDNVRVIYQDPTQQAPRSSSSWFWDYAVGFHLLQLLLWLRSRTRAALLELRAALEADPAIRAHFPVEIRFCRRDRIPLSPCFQRDSCYINVIMYRPYGRAVPLARYWLLYERIMRKHGGRPHWAKAHSCTRKDLEEMFPEFHKFCALREKLDPNGIFLNSYLEKIFF